MHLELETTVIDTVCNQPPSIYLSRSGIFRLHRRQAIIEQRGIGMKIDWFLRCEMILMISTIEDIWINFASN